MQTTATMSKITVIVFMVISVRYLRFAARVTEPSTESDSSGSRQWQAKPTHRGVTRTTFPSPRWTFTGTGKGVAVEVTGAPDSFKPEIEGQICLTIPSVRRF